MGYELMINTGIIVVLAVFFLFFGGSLIANLEGKNKETVKDVSSVFQLGILSLNFQSADKISVQCFFDDKGRVTYYFNPKNLRFFYKGSLEKLKIISVAEFSSDQRNTQLVWGKDALQNQIAVVNYPEQESAAYYYKAENLPKPSTKKKFVHLSFWRESDCVKIYMNRCSLGRDECEKDSSRKDKCVWDDSLYACKAKNAADNGLCSSISAGECQSSGRRDICTWDSASCLKKAEKFRFYELSSTCQGEYLSAVGINMSISEDSACFRALCPNLNDQQCRIESRCWWDSGGLGGWGSGCKCCDRPGSDCSAEGIDCGDFDSEQKCAQCGEAKTKCKWEDGECRYMNDDKGRILHVKIDIDDSPTEIWEMHLTDTPSHDGFDPKYVRSDRCNIYAVEEAPDVRAHWLIRSGGIIKKDGQLNSDGLRDYIDLVLYVGPAYNKAGDGAGQVGRAPYATAPYKDQHCSSINCALLEQDSQGKYYWKPQYELLCSKNIWEACMPGRAGIVIGQDTGQYRCESDWTWTKIA